MVTTSIASSLAINGILRAFRNVLEGDYTALYITGAILGVIAVVFVIKKALNAGKPPEESSSQDVDKTP